MTFDFDLNVGPGMCRTDGVFVNHLPFHNLLHHLLLQCKQLQLRCLRIFNNSTAIANPPGKRVDYDKTASFLREAYVL